VRGDKALEGVAHPLRATLMPVGDDIVATVHGFGWKVAVPVRVV